MLFKLSISNMKKSMKDYTIYFMTLILGVAIFYMFNSLDAQRSMMVMSSSTYMVVDLLINLLGGVSVFIAIVLAFLIVYANNFLMKRRKREFGIYMTLGMGKSQISRILIGETVLVGLISLAVGLAVGVFGSQLMSILVAKMFEANMEAFTFVFSSAAFWKTIVYFGIMYLAVMAFNTVMISRYPLIRLIHADKQGEKVKLKNPILSVIFFLISAGILGYAYYQVSQPQIVTDLNLFLRMVFLGMIGTFGIFWSLSGFLIKVVQMVKSIYLRRLHPFVLRQVGSQVNTMTVSMTVICLLLFLTICIFSGSMAMNESMKRDLQECAAADVNVMKEYRAEDETPLRESMELDGFDLSVLQDGWEEVRMYRTPTVTGENVLGSAFGKLAEEHIYFSAAYRAIDMIKVSDYNKLAAIYGKEPCVLGPNQYQVAVNNETAVDCYREAAQNGTQITINGAVYQPVSEDVLDGFVEMSSNKDNDGVLIVPDEALEGVTLQREGYQVTGFMAANYVGTTEEEKQENETAFIANVEDGEESYLSIHGLSVMTRQALYAASVGLGASIIFLGLYLGIVFLISSAALLALKVLSESTDNRARYTILRKIGADEKMISRALFEQSAFYFLLPLLLAVIHSIFGLKVADYLLKTMGQSQMTMPIIATAALLVLIYGGYFLITYWGSKRIIREK